MLSHKFPKLAQPNGAQYKVALEFGFQIRSLKSEFGKKKLDIIIFQAQVTTQFIHVSFMQSYIL